MYLFSCCGGGLSFGGCGGFFGGRGSLFGGGRSFFGRCGSLFFRRCRCSFGLGVIFDVEILF